MSKIAVSDILGDFQRMLDEHWKYTAGASETGNVDCSGAFVWAHRQHGQRIYHGSNRIARTEIVELVPISAAKPGMAVLLQSARSVWRQRGMGHTGKRT